MRLYNTLGRKLEDFVPINQSSVSMYTCGPTVYDSAQLGNLRSFVFEDTLRRTLQFSGYDVRHVMNITDVGHLVSDEDEGEDKLEKGAAREGKNVWDIARYYTERFKSDAKKLNILEPNGYEKNGDHYAKATDFINEQIHIVRLLIDKGFAYITGQAIYFDTSRLSSYGELTGQKLSEKETGARTDVITDSEKKHPQDFAVWFFTVGRFEHHEMHWESPWGAGFPGWHLECSAIIHATLGDPIDIHTGGVDHIGTHHTNEMAQTEAAFGHKLANYWLHNEFLLVDNQRMGKSQGNFFTLVDIEKRGFQPLSLRLLFLQTHYRSQMNFTWDSLSGAQAFLERLNGWADLRFQPAAQTQTAGADEYDEALQAITAAMADDLNSPQAVSHLSALVSKSESDGIAAGFDNLLNKLDDIFGLGLYDREDIDEEAKQILESRQQAREHGDYELSDELRGELERAGIEVRDTAIGQIWKRR